MGVGFIGAPSQNPVQGVGNPLFDKVTNSTYSSFGGGAFYTLVTPDDLVSGGFFGPGGALSAGELRGLMDSTDTPDNTFDNGDGTFTLPNGKVIKPNAPTFAAPSSNSLLSSPLALIAIAVILFLIFT